MIGMTENLRIVPDFGTDKSDRFYTNEPPMRAESGSLLVPIDIGLAKFFQTFLLDFLQLLPVFLDLFVLVERGVKPLDGLSHNFRHTFLREAVVNPADFLPRIDQFGLFQDR